MAIIQCKECDAQVSDSAPTCPHCGVSAPGGSCTVVFSRPSSMGLVVRTEVYVDGQPYGTLRAKGRIAVPVSPGDHHVEIQTSQGKSSVTTISASGGETPVRVSLSALTGKPKFG